MTIEELEIIIKANISDAISGIKQITNEVKGAVSKSVDPMSKLTSQAKNMASQSASSISKMKSDINSYKDSVNQTAKQQEYLKNKITELKEKLSKADMGYEVGDTAKIEAQIEQLENKLRKLGNQGKKSVEKTSNIFDEVKEKVKTTTAHISSMGTKFKKLLSDSKGFGKNFTTSFNRGINSIKKFALSLLSVRGAFTVISRAMQSYLSYDSQLSNSIQNCWNVLGSLLAPILEKIIGLFSVLVSYVNAFVNALTGIDLVARANTKSLNRQAKASKNASKQLSGIDDINNLSSNSGGATSGDKEPITVKDVNVDGIVDKLLNYDWYSVGLELGKKINDALASVPWDFIQILAITLGTNLGNLLNGMVDGVDWALIGTTIGNGIQTALLFAYTFMTTFNWQNFGTTIATTLNNVMDTVDFTLLGKTLASKWVALIDWLYGFVTTFDWAKFGTSIAEAVMGWFDSIDFSKIGETISKGIRGLFEAIKNLIVGIDWQQLGNDIWIFISSIDWGGMISDLAYILGQAIVGIGQFLWGFIEDAVSSISKFWSDKFSEAGGSIIKGLFNGILEIFANIDQWLMENIVDPFINGFKSMFGIHSPSTVMAELGTFIIEGLKNGLLGIWDKVKGIFTNFKTNITNTFSSILTSIKKVFSVNAIKSHFNNAVSAIKNIFASIPTWFKNIFTSAWTNVKNVFSSGGKIFSGIKDGIANTFKDIVNKIISGINKIIAFPFNKINNMLNKIRNTEFLGVAPFKGLWSQNPLTVPVIPSLASGGVLTEETLVRVAEYSNSKSNPEIVSPVSMMKDSFRDVLNEFTTDLSGNRYDKLIVNVAGKEFYQDTVDYINQESIRRGVSIIKEV